MARTKKYEPLPGQQSIDLFPEEESEVQVETKEKKEAVANESTASMLADLSMYWWTGKNLMDKFKDYVRWYKNRRTIENCLVSRKKIPGELGETFEGKRFRGSLSEVIVYVSGLEQDYLGALRLHNASCQKLNIPLMDDDWMRSRLWEDADRRQSIADKCARRFEHPENKRYRLVSLKEL